MAQPADGLDPGTRRRVEALVTDWLADGRVPGLSIAVVEGDELVYAEGFGARDLDSNAPATPGTLYGVGSCTKSITALAVMQLAESGDLSVEDPVDDYLPHLSGASGDPVTIHDLLTHSSGMPSDGNLSALLTRLTGVEPVEVPLSGDADFRRHVEGSAPERVTDGEPFFYYNSGYTLLGEVVEAASGRGFAGYVADEILAPLGMERSTFSRADFEAASDRMTPYHKSDGETEEAELAFDPSLHAPGGMISSVSELSNYLRMTMGGGSYGGLRLLGADRLSAMFERHATRRVALDGTETGYGYGWQIEEFLGDTLVGHGGSMAVTTAYLGFLEDAGVGVAIGCNTSPDPHPTVLGQGVLAVLRGEAPEDAVPWFALREKLDPLTGEYESYRGIRTATVERAGGTLEVVLDDGGRWREELSLLPETLDPEDRRFYTVSGTGERKPVRFEVTDDGVDMFVDRWRVHRRRFSGGS